MLQFLVNKVLSSNHLSRNLFHTKEIECKLCFYFFKSYYAYAERIGFFFNLLIFLKKKKQLLIAGSKYGGITRKHVLAVAVREPFEQQTQRGDTVLIYLRVCTR